MNEHTPTPWSYRPQKYDDWGFIRGPKEADGFAPIAAIARGETSETHDMHRAAGTDPYGPNALLIVKAVNSHDALVKALGEIEALSDNCVNAERYYDEDALEDLQAIRRVIALTRAVVGSPPERD